MTIRTTSSVPDPLHSRAMHDVYWLFPPARLSPPSTPSIFHLGTRTTALSEAADLRPAADSTLINTQLNSVNNNKKGSSVMSEPTSPVRVAVVQFDPQVGLENREANLRRSLELALEAVNGGANLI